MKCNKKMIKETVEQNLLNARKHANNESSIEKETLTLLKAGFQNEEIKTQHELTDDEAIKIIKSNVKQLNQTLDGAKKAGREDLITKTISQIDLLEAYLPAQLSENEIILELEKDNFDKTLPFGRAMGTAMKMFNGRADGTVVKSALQKYLS